MMKIISITALSLAMTAGIASAQSTTDSQRGAGAFDQGGVFETQENQAAPMIDSEPTGSILPNFGGQAQSDEYEAMPQAPVEQNVVPDDANQGQSNPMFDNSK